MKFEVHTITSAPETSRPYLEAARQAFGFVPNLLGVLAESPAALAAYLGISGALDKARLTPVEQQIVAVAVSAENGCSYCVAAHSTVAHMVRAPAAAVDAVRSDLPIPDARLEALRRFAVAAVRSRGRLNAAELQAFQRAGYDRGQLLDVLALVALKTLSNYSNHIANTPLDAAFVSQRWEPGRAAAA